MVQLARTLKRPRHTIKFILFDGEESPRGMPDRLFAQRGLRGAKVAARRYRHARAMVLLDFVADRRLSIPREGFSERAALGPPARGGPEVGVGAPLPGRRRAAAILDDHVPFLEQGVPSIDLIDFDFPCWHRRCDDLSSVSERSLDVTGEVVYRLLASL